MVIQKRVLAPTVVVSCWFGRVAVGRFWGVDAEQATTQTVASASSRLADTSGRREIAPLLLKTQTPNTKKGEHYAHLFFIT